MTRKPRKIARKVRKPRSVRKPPRKRKAAAKPARPDPLDGFIAAGARALDLEIPSAWLPMVRAHLKIIVQHGGRVATFTLPDETEPAPVFKA